MQAGVDWARGGTGDTGGTGTGDTDGTGHLLGKGYVIAVRVRVIQILAATDNRQSVSGRHYHSH